MILYSVGFVVAFIGWVCLTGYLTDLAFNSRLRTPQDVKNARLAWLSFFLLPLYPALFIIALVVVPIIIFRRLGRINKEEQ